VVMYTSVMWFTVGDCYLMVTSFYFLDNTCALIQFDEVHTGDAVQCAFVYPTVDLVRKESLSDDGGG